MSDAIEEATNARLPFGMGEVDITNPLMVAAFVIALTLGATFWNMADSIGQNFANYINATLGNILGQNPATGETADNGGAFD